MVFFIKFNIVMAHCARKYYLPLLAVSVLLMAAMHASAQIPPPGQATPPAQPFTPKGEDTSNVPRPELGPYDTIPVPAKVYGGEWLPSHIEEWVWVRAKMTPASRRRYEEWTRLRNAVYVTYPYARRAGLIINEMNAKLALLDKPSERKAYLESREKELKKEFSDPLEKLSVYQGKVLMKLINRQTGNNCYNLIKEYKGGFTARFYQTVAFFFGGNLKQPYDPKGDDQVIEGIVMEVERMYHG